MPEIVDHNGKPFRRGTRLTKKVPYRIYSPQNKRYFVASLIHTINVGKVRIAIFSIPK